MTIWKYQLLMTDEQCVNLPRGAEILCAQIQRGAPCIWVKCDPKLPTSARRIFIYGTGHEIGAAYKRYIGTVQCGDLVFHVFEE